MKRLPIVLLLMTILSFPFVISNHSGLTEDCFVQIVSVTLNQPSFEIGEQVQVNIVYDLYYDQSDPLGIGAVSVSLIIQGSSIPLSSNEFTNQGLDVQESITFSIKPNEWSPNATGQLGLVQVEGWVQDSVGSMTDSVQQPFSVERSDLFLQIQPLTPEITFHEMFNLTGVLTNPHNSSLFVQNHPLTISIAQNNQSLKSWNLATSSTGNFTQLITSIVLGTGSFTCNTTALESDDYRSTSSIVAFYIDNASLSLFVILNSSIVQTYYPSMNNCFIHVSANLYCQEANHSLEEAVLTCNLGNRSKILDYLEANHHSTEIRAPNVPGNYSLEVAAFTPFHDLINTSIPVKVLLRQALISFSTNCSEAAIGDFIGFSLNVFDFSSDVPIPNKICSIYLHNQSTWQQLTQVTLNQYGEATFVWQAQDVGNDNYQFKVIFHGNPEFNDTETEIVVINTHDIRFLCISTLHVVRPNDVLYIVQLTTLDYEPIPNVTIQIIQLPTNSSWSSSITNSSGYAVLTWPINETCILGPHNFLLIAQDGLTTLGTIPITMIVYEQTILELV